MRMQIMSFVIRSFVFPFHSLLFYSLSSFCLFSSSLFWIFFKSLAKLWRTRLPYAIPRQIVTRERPRTVLFPGAAAAPALPAASPAPEGTAPAAPGGQRRERMSRVSPERADGAMCRWTPAWTLLQMLRRRLESGRGEDTSASSPSPCCTRPTPPSSV